MSNIFKIIKYDLLMLKNRLTRNKDNKKNTIIILVMLCSVVYFIATMAWQSSVLLDQLYNTGLESFVITQMLLMYSFTIILFVINNSVVLNEKDSDFLLSLPIKKKEIIIAKSLIKYITYCLLGLGILIPTVIVYILKMNASYLLIFNSICLVLLLSLSFVGFSYLFNAFINFVIIRFKFYKLIRMVLVLSSVFAFLYVYVSFMTSINVVDVFLFSNLTSVISESDYLALIYVGLFSVVLFSLSIYVFSKIYGYNAKNFKNNDSRIRIGYKKSSPLKTLVKKEFKNYFSSSIYIMNTIIGNILLIAGSVYLVFDTMIPSDILPTYIYLILCFSLSLSCTTNSSISLEGKNLWIIKSSPIKYETVMFSKVLMNLILLVGTLTFSFIMLLISGKIDTVLVVSLFILSLLISLFISFGGILVNMLLPKLDFKNEMQVVKQSSASVSSILFFLLFLSAPAFIYMMGIFEMDLIAMVVINIGYIFILDVVIILVCYKYTTRLISNL